MGWDIIGCVKVSGKEADLQKFIEDDSRFENILWSYLDRSPISEGYILWKWESYSINEDRIMDPLIDRYPGLTFHLYCDLFELGICGEYILKSNEDVKHIFHLEIDIDKWFTNDEYRKEIEDSSEMKNSLYRTHFYERELPQEWVHPGLNSA